MLSLRTHVAAVATTLALFSSACSMKPPRQAGEPDLHASRVAKNMLRSSDALVELPPPAPKVEVASPAAQESEPEPVAENDSVIELDEQPAAVIELDEPAAPAAVIELDEPTERVAASTDAEGNAEPEKSKAKTAPAKPVTR